MATISNPTNPNKTVATTSNVAPQNAQQAPQQPTSSVNNGQYSTLQKYLGANQGSGQRLASAIGSNLGNEAKSLDQATQRSLSGSQSANKNIQDLTTQSQGLKSQLSQPASPQVSQIGPAYDVSSYATNLSGQQAAQDIAKNQEKLGIFQGIATGNTANKLKDESNKAANEALSASTKAYDINKTRQSELNNFGDRASLLQRAINSRNQRAGLQNLDNALLSQDKSGKLNDVNQELQRSYTGLQQNKNTAATQQGDIKNLVGSQQGVQSELLKRLSGMATEQQDVLSDRMRRVNEAKDIRTKELENKYKNLQEGQGFDEDLSSALQLQNTFDVDAEARRRIGMSAPDQKLSEGPDLRTFNALSKFGRVQDAVDLNTLSEQASSGKAVANQSDLDLLSNLSALTQGSINPLTNDLSLSKYIGNQIGESKLDDQINTEANAFLDTVQDKKAAHAFGDAKSGGGDWYAGEALVEASNADYLYKQQLRKALRTESDAGSGNKTGLVNQATFSPQEQSIIDSQLANGGVERFGLNTGVLTRGFNDRSAYNYNQGSSGEAASKAEDIAIGNVQSRIQNELANMGYSNLAKRMRGR